MKKWIMIFAVILMFPMSDVQAGKKTAFLERETEIETEEELIIEQEEDNQPESEQEEETKPETQESEQDTEESASAADTGDAVNNTEVHEKNGGILEQDPSKSEELSIDIKDDIQTGFDYQNGKYIKRAAHTILLTRVEKIYTELGKPDTNPNIYESISYKIYEKTEIGEISLKEGSLEIPENTGQTSTNKIEMEYGHSGNYCIKIIGKLKKEEREVELICRNFSIEKDTQEVILKEDTVDIYYDDNFYIEDYAEAAKKYEYWSDYEIWEESGDKNKILEVEKQDGRYLVKAIGINDIGKGTTTVKVRLKENPFMSASDEKTLTINVNPLELDLEAQIDVPAIYMYDTLTIRLAIYKQGKNITQELLETDNDLGICFKIASEDKLCELNSKNLKCEKGNSYTFYIPIKREYFKKFSKGQQYNITAELKYIDSEKEFFPYKVNTAVKRVELLGRKAVMHLSAEKNGIYDYRTYYKGIMPNLNIEIEDATAVLDGTDDSETGKNALSVESEEIVYQVKSENERVVSVDYAQRYTAKDGRIPLHINGVGTTVLTVATEGNSVYTVESQKVNITVENSPLYDEDFVICVENIENTEEQAFCGNAGKTGFQEWQAYLDAHGGWVRGRVYINLTEKGLDYYEQIGMMTSSRTEDKQNVEQAKQIKIDGDKEITEYVFWAENNSTKADTRNVKHGEDGTRSFRMGIDVTAPEIERFIPSGGCYIETSTDKEQYFSEHFVLTGSFQDAVSGVANIEYTTNANAEGGAKWVSLGKSNEAINSRKFKVELENGIYHAIAVRAIDAAGNVSEPVCLKNEKGEFIKIVVDDTPPAIDVLAMTGGDNGVWYEYHAEDENWTNKEIKFQISEKTAGDYAGLYKVEYIYRSIAAALCGEETDDEEWQEIVLDENGIASLLAGGDGEKAINQNGYYYFRGVSKSGVTSDEDTEKRILLWQKMEEKKPITESGVDLEKCCNEWYNKASGMPILDFAYPEYDTGVISGEYAAPITIHYNLRIKDEKNNETLLADDKTAVIRADIPEINERFDGFLLDCDDLSKLQVVFSEDGIYTLEYWITDAAGNASETEIHTYKIDCHEPTSLRIALNDEELVVGNESTLTYEKFYQSSVSGEASAEYGISGKGSIKLLKAKKIGEWKNIAIAESAEQFQVDPGIRCLLYIRAVDGAGNMTEGWTKGIVVDNEAPTGDGTPRLIAEPEGANKHGFFNKDVKVKISIKDAPDNENCAGLKLVTSTIGTEDGDTISEKELFSGTEEHISENFCIIETISAKANEGNHAYITVKAMDCSENMSTDTREFKIDVTKPETEITFDNENAVNGRYYNMGRRAKVHIKESNFDASLVKINVTRNGKNYTPSISDWQSDKNNHYAYIDFSEDGDYTFSVECIDLADNEADIESAEPFTIDKTMPSIKTAIENSDAQSTYFNRTQTVVITVTEHNFNADDFHINIQPAGKMGTWEHKNDTHVIKIELLSEGEYTLSCDCRDLAGNGLSDEDKADMPLELVIDITNPLIEISGVENNSANAGEVIPNISVRDRNIAPETVTITLTTGRGAAADISSEITSALAEEGFLYTISGLDEMPDDIYYLMVAASDKAGNTEELTYRFSLNRRGSAYDLTDLTKLRDSYYNCYKNIEDIKIVEMNVDKVEEFTLYLSHNADIIYGKNGSRPLAQAENKPREAVLYDVDVSGNENTGYVYTYTIFRENFASEGVYRLGIYSKDKAGNEVNNLLKQNGEEIQFVVDNTMPRVVIDGVEKNEIYDVESQDVRVVADDNFMLAEAELTLVNKDGDILESWNYFDLAKKEGDTVLITIEEYKEEVSLLYRAVDAAGNEIRTLQNEKDAKTDFLVTTDKFVQLVNKTVQAPAGQGIIIALILSFAGAAAAFVLFKAFLKKRK